MGRLKSIHEGLLSRPEHTAAELELLEELYINGSWLGRRILLRRLGPEHAYLIPTLARVASRADPTTRRSLVAALARIGHVSAEPILVTLLGEVEPGVLPDVLGVLATLGTRACLPHLPELRELHPGLADRVDATLSAIDARYPSRHTLARSRWSRQAPPARSRLPAPRPATSHSIGTSSASSPRPRSRHQPTRR